MQISNVSMSARTFFSTTKRGEFFIKNGKIASYIPTSDTLTFYDLYATTEEDKLRIQLLMIRLPHRTFIRPKTEVEQKFYKPTQPKQMMKPRGRSLNKRWSTYINSQNLRHCYEPDE